MKGIIVHTNTERGMYSAKLSNGTFVVFELVDPIELRTNAAVSGEFDRSGEREITLDETERLHIYIDNCDLSEILAFQKTFLIA